MKPHYTLALLGLMAGQALAQPALNADYAPALGTRLVLNNGSAVRNADSLGIRPGTGQTWSYAFNSVRAQSFVLRAKAAAQPAADFFPTADLALVDESTNSRVLYFSQAGGSLRQLGDVIVDNDTVYLTPGQTYLPYGIGFQAAPRVETYRKAVVFDPSFIIATRVSDTIRYIGDGYMTLNGTDYSDVVLIRHGLLTTDTSGFGGSRSQLYQWFAPGLGYPLLSITINRQGTASVQFVSDEVVGVRPSITQSLRLYPIPARHTVRITGLAALPEAVRTISVSGQSRTLPCRQGYVDVSALASGIYVLEAAGQRTRLVVE